MRLLRIAALRMRSLFGRSRAEAQLECEIELHLEQLARQYTAQGMSERDARDAARREFGPSALVRERCRDARGVNLLEDLARDLAYACRRLRRAPGFTVTAVLSLALGLGVNAVVFSVLDTLVLKPLPVADPGRIFFVDHSGSPANSFPNYRDIRDRNSVFQSLFSYRLAQVALDDGARANRLWAYLVTGNYFETLGLKPVVGRFFTPAEDLYPGESPYAVLSYACWRNRFAGDPGIAGRQVRINGRGYTILGVAPRAFHGTEVFFWAEIWLPMMMQPQIEGSSWLDTRNTFNAWIAGRLKPGVSREQAEANLASVARQLAREHTVNEGMRLSLSRPGLAGAMGRGPTQAFAGGVMLLAALVLLAACANLAALAMARAADNGRDLAIRVSIGAGRGRLARQLLTESLVVSFLGGSAGFGAASLLLQLLSQWRAPLDFPVQFDVNADWRVFLFSLAVSTLTGVLFGLGPAFRAWNTDPALSLKGGEAPVSGRRWGARDLLLPVQIALCCVLVTASLVAARGMMRSLRTPLGIAPDGAAVAGCDLFLGGYDRARGSAFQQRALAEIARLPGVEAAGFSTTVPLSIDQSNTTVYPETATDFRPKNAYHPFYYYVSPGYFAAVGTRLVAGRDFGPQDSAQSPRAAIVNQTFARRVVGTGDAAGRRFRRGPGGKTLVEIVGVVEDGKYVTLAESPREAVFFPASQNEFWTMMFVARSRRPEAELASEMRLTLGRLDPHLAVYGVGGLRQILGLAYLPIRAAVITLGAFGLLALMLAITGICGLSAYAVARRTPEIGIRMALGAQPAQVLRFVFGRIGALTAAGACAGLALAAAGSGVLARVVDSASAREPAVMLSGVGAISLAAVTAALGPARRAVRLDPVRSLRHD